MSKKEYKYPRLSDAEYNHAKMQLRLQLNGVFYPFQEMGHQALVPGAIDATMELVEQFGMRVRGKEQPIYLDPYKYRLAPLR